MVKFRKTTFPSMEVLQHTLPNTANITITTNKQITHINLDYNDYRFLELKKDLQKLVDLLPKNRRNPVSYYIQVNLDNKKLVFETKVGMDDPATVVDLAEVIQACVPHAPYLFVSTQKIFFAAPDSLTATKTVAIIGGAIKNHFSEELTTPFLIKPQVKENISLEYRFKWLTKTVETINETVVNSNKYLQLVDFVAENPHPDVEQFIFGFRDSSKGMLTEMNLEFKPTIPRDKQYETTVFIRGKLNEKFPGLAIY